MVSPLKPPKVAIVTLLVAALILFAGAAALGSRQEPGCNQTPNGATGPGANHSGRYDDTCTGAPSGNGNGNGNANGKPCAGCVGKADEKNPQGQFPDGSDHNRGYA